MKLLLTLLLCMFIGCSEKSVLPDPCPTMDEGESKYSVIHKAQIMIRGTEVYIQYTDGFQRSYKKGNSDSMMFFMGALKGSRETENAIYSLTYKQKK